MKNVRNPSGIRCAIGSPVGCQGIVVTDPDYIVNYINGNKRAFENLEMILRYLESTSDNLKNIEVLSNMNGYVNSTIDPTINAVAYQMKDIESLMSKIKFTNRLKFISERLENKDHIEMIYYLQRLIIDGVIKLYGKLDSMFDNEYEGGSIRKTALKKQRKTPNRRPQGQKSHKKS